VKTLEEINAAGKEAANRNRRKLDMLVDNITDLIVDMAALADKEAQKILGITATDRSLAVNLAMAIQTVNMNLKIQLITGDLVKRLKDRVGR